MEGLISDQWETLTKTLLTMALRGDSAAMKLCMDRLAPVRRGSSVTIPDFPKVETVADVPRAQAAILAAVAAGHLTADEATPLSAILTAFVTAVDATTFAERLAELEKRLDENRRHGPR